MTQSEFKSRKSNGGTDYFCINPFLEVNVTPAGSVRACCAFFPFVAQEGRTMSVYEHTIEEIWNSEDMRSVRRKLTNGEPVKQCSYCYNQEKTGARSIRIDALRAWEAGWLNPRGETIEDIKAKARANDFRLPDGPEWLDLDVGNLCNLKCRMCHGLSSSSIDSDPVHSRWTSSDFDFEIPARWQGLAMSVAPRHVLGVVYHGISHPDRSSSPVVAWIQGIATIHLKMLGEQISHIQLKLRKAEAQQSPLEIFVNGVPVYRGELCGTPFDQTIELPTHIVQGDDFTLRIESPARAGVEEVKLLRTEKGANNLPSRFSSGKQWFQDDEFLSNDLLYKIHNVTRLNFVGGEPLLIKEVRSIMKQIISRNVAKNITLTMTTNGTIAVDDEWRNLAAQFKAVGIAVSLDGYAGVNDYIRYPSQWKSIEPNIKRLQLIQNANISVNMTVQAYNMLHVPALAQYCEEMDMDLRFHFLESPRRLSCLVMPREARIAAAQKIRNFAMANAQGSVPSVRRKMDVRETLLELAAILEENDKPADSKLLNDFMIFTNDLDADRGQDFASVNGELKDLIVAYGARWNAQRSQEGARL